MSRAHDIPDDDDFVATFHAMREASKEKRADNREYSAAELTRLGVFFEPRNMGAHRLCVTLAASWTSGRARGSGSIGRAPRRAD